MSASRISNLDLLRALAIVTVTAYHVLIMIPGSLLEYEKFVLYGMHGVDLFFVISGWLIGGLYWQESSQFGNVQAGRFWMRRWLRTIPPYLAGLLLSWLAAYIHSRKPFDPGYLIFIQNYYDHPPFFVVSWSLCIEEHFYLLMPLLFAFIPHVHKPVTAVFATLLLVAPASRWIISLGEVSVNFGFQQTATHLRMEGLLLGFWLAFVKLNSPHKWETIKSFAPWVLAGSASLFALLQFSTREMKYVLGLTVLAIGLAALLVVLVDRPASWIASTRLVRATAQASFSVYLTHPIMIHLARKAADTTQAAQWQVYFPTALILIVLAGAGFYYCVERTSILLRDKWVPRRRLPSTAIN